jgi:adenosylcobyric acid synthase
MIQGTSSSAGKSLLVAALCRIFARRGVRVAPFKAQNMSNNAAVCPDGREIGRAQAVQAQAAGIEPMSDMNPILLKPEADARSQVVLDGHAWRTLPAREYYRHKSTLWSAVTRALDRLRAEYDLVIIEGAGSPVELNLKPGDLVNMAVARYARSPVLLVGDIDRGGIFAQLLGTLWLLPPEEAALVRGFIVNKFRGDMALFADGVRLLAERGGVAVLGVVPYIDRLDIPDEDSVVIDDGKYPLGTATDGTEPAGRTTIDIAVINLPRIANFDDFDPLIHASGVRVRYVDTPQGLGRPDAVILPGTKSTCSDLAWLRHQGLDTAIKTLAGYGVAVVGICGGYQMLGCHVRDPDGVEAPAANRRGQAGGARGLALLPLDTVFDTRKTTHRAEAQVLAAPGWLAPLVGSQVLGYEIHMGRTEIIPSDTPGAGAVAASRGTCGSGRLPDGHGETAGCWPWLRITRRSNRPVDVLDGAVGADGRVWGCYLHGLFENDRLREAWLGSLGWCAPEPTGPPVHQRPAPVSAYAETGTMTRRQIAFDRLADIVEAALDMDLLERILQGDDA